MKKILFIHGWMHTIEIFHDVLKYLDADIEPYYFVINGLDNSEYSTIDIEIKRLRHVLTEENFDCIVAHSLGTLLLLQNADIVSCKCLLCNPIDRNPRIWLRVCIPLLSVLLVRTKLKILYLPTCSMKFIDEDVMRASDLCNIRVAREMLRKMFTYNVETNLNSLSYDLLWSSRDYLLSRPVVIIDKADRVLLVHSSHTSMKECPDEIARWIHFTIQKEHENVQGNQN